MAEAQLQTSPFLHPGSASAASSLALLYLSRDHSIPVILHHADDDSDATTSKTSVTNTRFGSFQHSTLIGKPWGSQVLASKPEPSTRGKKRKVEELQPGPSEESSSDVSKPAQPQPHIVTSASSGFAHLLPPTPESWTTSLPHRTQVVYTPDYSHVIQRLQLRPGSVLLEAGGGSGSFTHAAARAVFNGYPPSPSSSTHGRVHSYEYHSPRAAQLRAELSAHGLASLAHVHHRDVYADGFLLDASASPRATHVFLDLPAPHRALPHLARGAASPLDPRRATRLAAFLPCVEQVQRFAAALAAHGWVETAVQEVSARRVDVRRERVGLANEGLRGVNAAPADVDEAVGRLVEVERNARAAREGAGEERGERKAQRLARIAAEASERKTWVEGRLVHRTEQEVRCHTSYLVFAVLPRAWSDEDERRCREKWGTEKAEKHGAVEEGVI